MWIVRLIEQRMPYGPFADRNVADRFSCFLAAEVDPAEVEPLNEPAAERLFDPVTVLLNWRDAVQARPIVRGGPDLGIEGELGYGDERNDQ